VAIAGSDRYGIWHASCRGETTWHRFALRLAERLGVAPSWQAVPSAALTLPAPRPPNCLLDNRRLALYGLAPLPTWEEALDEYLATDSTPPSASQGT
jgi:dTDP-4-dehydrorhamnose reductase